MTNDYLRFVNRSAIASQQTLLSAYSGILCCLGCYGCHWHQRAN
ncbi:hypothetical protein [Nostoc sp. 106C]|nr:hypothetical protein [Nostoc sp. 106C]